MSTSSSASVTHLQREVRRLKELDQKARERHESARAQAAREAEAEVRPARLDSCVYPGFSARRPLPPPDAVNPSSRSHRRSHSRRLCVPPRPPTTSSQRPLGPCCALPDAVCAFRHPLSAHCDPAAQARRAAGVQQLSVEGGEKQPKSSLISKPTVGYVRDIDLSTFATGWLAKELCTINHTWHDGSVKVGSPPPLTHYAPTNTTHLHWLLGTTDQPQRPTSPLLPATHRPSTSLIVRLQLGFICHRPTTVVLSLRAPPR